MTVRADGDLTAAEAHGWGAAEKVETFDAGLATWNVYDGPGHANQGRRSPGAAAVRDGILTITGDAAGTTAGMGWGLGATYGRWEVRMRAPVSDPSYRAVLLLWPDAEDFPVGGEIDFAEMLDPTRQTTNLFLHYGASNAQVGGTVTIDATQWHIWAVEWTPHGVIAYVDGQMWWRTTNLAILPPRSMHLCIQLDFFPTGGAVTPSQMFVDWAAFYPVQGSGISTPPPNSGGVGTPTSTPTPTLTPTPTPTPTTQPPTTTTTTIATPTSDDSPPSARPRSATASMHTAPPRLG